MHIKHDQNDRYVNIIITHSRLILIKFGTKNIKNIHIWKT